MTKQQSVLWLLDLNHTPYHLGISSAGKFFSLRAHTKDEGKDVVLLLKQLSKKNISLGFIPLMNQLSENHIASVFSSYHSCLKDETSCLKPVLKALDVPEGMGYENWTLFELVDYLEEIGQNPELYVYPQNTTFNELMPYSYSDVQANLRSFVSE